MPLCNRSTHVDEIAFDGREGADYHQSKLLAAYRFRQAFDFQPFVVTS